VVEARRAFFQAFPQAFQTFLADGVARDGGGGHADHFVEEAGAMEGEVDLGAGGFGPDRMDGADGVFLLFRAARGVGGEVVGSGE